MFVHVYISRTPKITPGGSDTPDFYPPKYRTFSLRFDAARSESSGAGSSGGRQMDPQELSDVGDVSFRCSTHEALG